jgi:predicted ATPase
MPTGAAPRRPSPLVGRDDAVESLLAALASHRVVTVLGPPGMGKTAVAREVASRLDGPVVWAELTGCTSDGHALATIARALEARPPRGVSQRSLAQWLGRELEARAIGTLVLDEAESVAAELSPLLAELATCAPQCRFLLTSRERLGAGEEEVIELGALAVDDAARLFVARAESAGAPKIHVRSDVEALVVALDGLPLAIELAASRARLLSPAEILSRLSRRLDLLSGGGATKSRHRALRAAIDGSWEALPETLQAALAQASCFAGGFAVTSAEAVIDLGEGESVLDALSALRDRALLSREGESSRFHLLASIRAYAAERLDERGDRAAVHARHAAHYLSLAERHAESIAARGDADARAALLIEQDNVARVLGDPRTSDVDVVRGTLALETVMATHGPFDGLLDRLDDAVRRSEKADVPPRLRARALLARGNTHGIQGHTAESVADLDACLSLSRDLGDLALEGEALMMLTVRYRQQSRIAEAWQCGQRSLTLLGAHGRPSIKGGIWAFVGRFAAEELGDLGLARELDERACALFRDLGDRWSEGLALGNLAQLDHVEGRIESAKWYFAETLSAFREVGDRRYEGAYLAALANLLHETGDLDGARARYDEACVVLGAARVGHVEGITRAAAGALEADAGRIAEARVHFDRASALLARTGASSFGDVLSLHRGHLELADASGDRAALATMRNDLARRRADLATRWNALIPVVERAVPLERRAGDLAFALRLLDRALAPADATLEVGPDARWFRPPGGVEVPMLRRGAVRLVLLALARSRAASPGVALPRDALLEAGWPGELVLAEAGATRVRVAIATLRSLGLGDVLQTRDDGYLLDPDVGITLR